MLRKPTHYFTFTAALALSGATAQAAELNGSNFSSRSENANGTSSVTWGRTLPVEWETKVGLDAALTRPGESFAVASQSLPESPAAASGSAFAKMRMPGVGSWFGWDKTEVEARLDPSQEQGRLGATLSRSVPLSTDFKVTAQNGYGVKQGLGHAGTGAGAAGPVLESNRILKFEVLPSATALSAGQVFSSADDKWLNTFGAEQKLFGGPVTISGALTETVQGDTTRSITAAFRRKF